MADLAPSPESRCARHADAPALELCARCGDLVCRACWSPAHALCELCAKRDPLYHVALLPWEDASLSLGARIGGTLRALLRPWSRAAALARGDLQPALRFALLVSLPLACLSTVIPLTHTLLFAPTLQIQLIGQPTLLSIVWDVVRAILYGPLVTLLMLIPTALGLIFGALLSKPKLWLRSALYWSWLPPSLLLATYLPVWMTTQAGWLGFAIWPLVAVWWIGQGYTARRAALLGWPRTLLVLGMAGVASLVGLAMAGGLIAALAPAAP